MSTAKVKIGDVVKVTWEDAWSESGYYTPEAIAQAQPLHVFTVGVVIRNDDTGIYLGRETSSHNLKEYRYINCIPRGMIRKVQVFK